MKKRVLFIILIVSLAFFIRFFKLGEYPSGFYSDEALFGYEAYSIMKTGRDQYGSPLPLSFRAFGDYRPGLFVYATVPFIYFLDLNEFSARLPSVVFNTLTVLTIILISYEIYKNYRISLLAGFLGAISPWGIQLSRMSHETNLATFMISSAILFFLKRKNNNYYIVISLILFALSTYAYYSSRLLAPILILLLFIIYRRDLIKRLRYSILGLLISFLIILPLVFIIQDKASGWSRVDNVSLWGSKGIIADIIQANQEDVILGLPYSRLLHNKIIDGLLAFSSSYLSHFEPRFLLFSGDPNKIYNTPGNGILLHIEPILLFIAGFVFIKQKYQNGKVLLIWAFFGLLPDSLTRFAPALPRIHLVLPVVSIVGGLGLYRLFLNNNINQWFKLIFITLITVVINLNLLYFLHHYFYHLPIRYANEWQYGTREIVNKIRSYNNLEKVWISDSAGLWVYYLFYFKYSPELIQREIQLSKKNEFGLGKVYQFGKYFFDRIPLVFDDKKNILYIGKPEEFYDWVKPKQIIYYPNKNKAFYLLTTQELLKPLDSERN